MIREMGEETAHTWAIAVLTEADHMTGAKTPPGTVAMWARLMVSQYSHRSVESIVIAIRDGMNSGKVYGALTYPQVAEWLNAHEDRIIGAVESANAAHKFTGDNLGAQYLDRLEAGDPVKQLRAQVQELRRKLSNSDPA